MRNTTTLPEAINKMYKRDARSVLREFLSKGLTHQKVAEKLNCDSSTISRYCRLYGLSVKKIEAPISVVESESFNAKIINRDNVLSRRWRCHDI